MMLCRGDIWLINLNPSKKPNEVAKIRPALILQNDELNTSKYPTTIILPLTTQLIDDAQPLRFRINARKKLEQDSDILVGQIRAIDNDRFIQKLASLDAQELKEVKTLLDELLT